MSTIVARPFEEEALFNAAFVSVLLSEAAKQYDEKSGRHAMPVILPLPCCSVSSASSDSRKAAGPCNCPDGRVGEGAS